MQAQRGCGRAKPPLCLPRTFLSSLALSLGLLSSRAGGGIETPLSSKPLRWAEHGVAVAAVWRACWERRLQG